MLCIFVFLKSLKTEQAVISFEKQAVNALPLFLKVRIPDREKK